jgi:hypothetical protein
LRDDTDTKGQGFARANQVLTGKGARAVARALLIFPAICKVGTYICALFQISQRAPDYAGTRKRP